MNELDRESGAAAEAITGFLNGAIDLMAQGLAIQSLPLVGALGPHLRPLAAIIQGQFGSYLTPSQITAAAGTPAQNQFMWNAQTGDVRLELQGTAALNDLPLALGLGGRAIGLSLQGTADAHFAYHLILNGGRNADGTFFLDTTASKLSTSVDLDLGAFEAQGRFGPVAVSAVNQASTSPSFLGQATSAHAVIGLVPFAAGGKITGQTIDDVLGGKIALANLVSATGSGSGLLSFGLKTAIDAAKGQNASFESIPPNFNVDFTAPLQVSFAKSSDPARSFLTVDPLQFNFENMTLDVGTVMTGLAAPAIAAADRVFSPFYSVSAFFQKPMITSVTPEVTRKDIWTKPFEAIQQLVVAEVTKNIVDNLIKLFDMNADGTVSVIESVRGAAFFCKQALDRFDTIYQAAAKLPTWPVLKPGFDEIKASLDIYKNNVSTFITALDVADLFFAKLQKFQTFSRDFSNTQAQGLTQEFHLGDVYLTSPTSLMAASALSGSAALPMMAAPPVTGYTDIDRLLTSMYELGFQLPALTDPKGLISALFGREADLLTFQDQLVLPPVALELPVDLFQLVDLVMPGFSKIVSLLPLQAQIELYAAFAMQANVSLGIDTSGIIKAAATGNPLSTFDGFYVSTLHNGVNLPELLAELTVGAKGNASAGIPAFGVELLTDVGIEANALLDLVANDPSGKLRGSELLSKLAYPSQLFDAQVTADLFVDASAEASVNLSKLTKIPASVKVWIDAIPGAKTLLKAVETVSNFLPTWSGEIGFQWSYPLLKWNSASLYLMAGTNTSEEWAYVDGKIDDARPQIALPNDAGSSYLRIVGENDRGDIFGNYQTKDGAFRGFATGLSLPAELNGRSFFIEDFNDQGQFVASLLNADGSWSPILGDTRGFVQLTVPEAQQLRVHDINDKGEIIIDAMLSDGTTHAYVGPPHALKEIVVDGLPRSVYARAINENGDIAGFIIAEDGHASGLLIAGGQVSVFDFPGAVDTVFNSINNKGQIVGEYIDPDTGTMESFLLSRGSFYKLLPDESDATSVSSIADDGTISFALNSNGEVRDLTLSAYEAFSPVEKSTSADAIYLLYKAILGRVPDAAGFVAWTDAAAHVDMRSIAGEFISSAEFKTKAAGASDAAFIATLYAHALGRAPETGAVDAWSMHLMQGASRADIVLEIVHSAEIKNVTGIATTEKYNLFL